MNRRGFLKGLGLAAASGSGGVVFGEPGRGIQPDSLPVADLRRSMTGTVLTPADASFRGRSGDYNRRVGPTPAVIALCQSAHDAAVCVNWARTHQVPLSLRSGGHSYEGFSLCRGIVIDVSAMDTVRVNAREQTAEIGAGARLGHIYRSLHPSGLVLAGGACPSVGIAGLTLGGGYGLLARKWGLTADNLLSLDLVDASGRLLTASPDNHSDLFWACRGAGGGQFGVVTSLKFRLHPLSSVVLYEIHWPMSEVRTAFQSWQRWAPFAADELTSEFVIAAGVAACKSVGQFAGAEDALRAVLRPLTRAGTPQVKVWSASILDAVKYFGGPEEPRPIFLKAKSDYALRELSAEGLDTLLAQLRRLGGAASGWVQFDSYGGAINRVPRDATAFVHRGGTLFSIQYNAIWEKAEQTSDSMTWIRDLYRAMRPYVSGYAYVNYCDLDLTNWQNAYYGASFKRLTRVKAAYDPGDLFSFPQSIPPASPPA